MNAPDRRLSQLRKLAWACALLVLAVTSLSAFIRLSRAGLGCEPWPQCYALRGTLDAQALVVLEAPPVVAARLAHRVVASATLLLVIAMLVLALARRPRLWPQGRLVLALLALALFLAVLGRMGGASRAPAVTLGNLLGGFAMFALACRLVQACGTRAASVASLRRWTLAGLALLALQIALGGAVSAGPWADRCDASILCQVHRLAALAVVGLLLPLGVAAWRRGERRLGAALAVLVLLQAGLGVAFLSSAQPLALALAHNVVGALLLATLVALLPGAPGITAVRRPK